MGLEDRTFEPEKVQLPPIAGSATKEEKRESDPMASRAEAFVAEQEASEVMTVSVPLLCCYFVASRPHLRCRSMTLPIAYTGAFPWTGSRFAQEPDSDRRG